MHRCPLGSNRPLTRRVTPCMKGLFHSSHTCLGAQMDVLTSSLYSWPMSSVCAAAPSVLGRVGLFFSSFLPGVSVLWCFVTAAHMYICIDLMFSLPSVLCHHHHHHLSLSVLQSLLVPGKSPSKYGRRGSAIGIGTVEEVHVFSTSPSPSLRLVVFVFPLHGSFVLRRKR